MTQRSLLFEERNIYFKYFKDIIIIIISIVSISINTHLHMK